MDERETIVRALRHNEGMSKPADRYRPADNLLFHYEVTSEGTVLANLRFLPATAAGVVLLVLAFATAGSGPAMLVVWGLFTALWIIWACTMPLFAVHSEIRPKPRLTNMVTLPALTPEQEAMWGKGKPTPLSPEQWAMLRKPTRPVSPSAVALPKKPAAKKPVVPRPPAPEPQPFGVDHYGAELLAAKWMRHLGVLDAKATRHVQDGGIDVDSELFVAQVKHLTGGVGGPDLHRLAGVASVAGKHGLFFTNTYYTPAAVFFAEDAKIALFRYEAREGALHGENAAAQAAIDGGDLGKVFLSRPGRA